MRKINFFILLFGLNCLKTIAQYEFKLDTLLKTDDTLISYNLINNIEIKSVNIKKKSYKEKGKYKIYINNEMIDIEARILNLPLIFDNYIFLNLTFLEETSLKTKIYFLKNEKLEFYSDAKEIDYDNSLKKVYKIKDDYLKIYLYNPITKDEKLYCDFSDVIKKWDLSDEGEKFPLESIGKVYFINAQTAYVELCYSDISPECEETRYFLVNKNGEKKEITSKVGYAYNKKIEKFYSEISFISNGYIRELLKMAIIENKTYKWIRINRLFDDNFNYISELLYFEPKIIGLNAKNGIVQYYYLESTTKDNEVFIPYKFLPKLDIAMYKVYNNNLLTDEDMKGFGKYELGILRNLIFAKHNYAFDSEFYQAYFNLYEFYNNENMKSSRTKDINNKLTEMDKKNLEIIKNKEKLISIVKK